MKVSVNRMSYDAMTGSDESSDGVSECGGAE